MYLTKRLSIQLLILTTALTQQINAETLASHSVASAQTDSLLPLLIRQAVATDEWISARQLASRSQNEIAIKSAQLPDPKLSLGLANMPLDSFDFDQEAMTQLKFSISQMLPRGDSLELKKQSWAQKSQVTQVKQFERAAQVEREVSLLWLDTYQANQSIALIEANRGLFEQLLEVSQASYSSALGRTRQGDIIKAELELIRLEDRLTGLALKKQANYVGLGKWVDISGWSLPQTLPQIALKQAQYFYDGKPEEQDKAPSDQVIAKALMQHPSLQVLDEEIQLAQISTSLAKQAYEPQWGVNASYGYRDDADNGMSRSDFLSLGVTLDMPLFSQKAQDAGVKAKQLTALSIELDQALKLKQMVAKYRVIQTKVAKLQQRKDLYLTALIPQLKQQESIFLAAYNSNDGPFSDVIKARIESLNAQIEVLSILVSLQKQKVEYNYLFARLDNVELAESLTHSLPSN
ncbi:MAG: TolC family protein [Marinomonas sp.]